MRIYPHCNKAVPADFRRGLYEPLYLLEDQPVEVPDRMGELLLGAWSLSFCQMQEGEKAEDHYCAQRPRPEEFHHIEMETPPEDRQMLPKRKRGRPKTSLLAKVIGRT